MTFEDGVLIGLWGLLIVALVGALSRYRGGRVEAEARPDFEDGDLVFGTVIEGEVI